MLAGSSPRASSSSIGSLTSSIFAQQTVSRRSRRAASSRSLALALVLIYRATEVINFAQGEMAMATTYIAYQLTLWGLSLLGRRSSSRSAIAFVFGVVVAGQRVIRPVQHRSVIAVVIVTIGLFSLIDGVVIWIWGADLKFMPAPFGNTVYHVGGVAVRAAGPRHARRRRSSRSSLLWLLFQFTKLGLAMRAAALRPAAARARRRARQLDARARLGLRRRARRGRRPA